MPDTFSISRDVYPDQAQAWCSRDQAERLVSFDHHRVRVGGRQGVMLTYHWLPLETAVEPLLLTVVFHYAEQHPPAPPEVQVIIDQLTFTP